MANAPKIGESVYVIRPHDYYICIERTDTLLR